MTTDNIADKVENIINFLNPLGKKEKIVDLDNKRCVVRELKHNTITWIDIENPKRKQLTEIAEQYNFHPLHVDACLLKGQLDRIETEEKYVFLLLRTPIYNSEKTKVVTYQVCVFLGKNFIVTVHKENARSLSNLFSECETDEKKREDVIKKSSGYVLYQVLHTLILDIVTLHDAVLKEVDEIEDLVFDIGVSGAYEVSKLRQKIIRLRRVVSSFKKIVQELATTQSGITENMTRYYKNLTNEVIKLSEVLEEAKETVEIYKDADFTVSTERTNKLLTALTIVFTLSIPATIAGSFYGMNILLPGGLEAGSWTFLGPYTTFYFVLTIAVLPVLIMLLYFKRNKWF